MTKRLSVSLTDEMAAQLALLSKSQDVSVARVMNRVLNLGIEEMKSLPPTQEFSDLNMREVMEGMFLKGYSNAYILENMLKNGFPKCTDNTVRNYKSEFKRTTKAI
jgi:predicted DNA-binding protein